MSPVVGPVVRASSRLPGLLDGRGWRLLEDAEAVVVRGAPGRWAGALVGAGLRWRVEADGPAGTGDVVLDLTDARPALEPPGTHLLDLVAVMDRLRSPGGCPWDAQQTHASLAPYALEEAYEVVEAVEAGTTADLLEELGDLLLQVVFHARVAQEAADGVGFRVDDVADGVVAKLVRRHPHVFARQDGDDAVGAAEVEAGWEARKQQEKGRGSALDGIPVALPALARAAKVVRRATRVGLVPVAAADADDLGERLLSVVLHALVEEPGVDPEGSLRAAVRRTEALLREQEGGRAR